MLRKTTIGTVVMFFVSAFSVLCHASPASPSLDAKHFVFITGYNAEKLTGYMDENVRALVGAGASQAHVIRPPSEVGVVENAAFIRDELLRLYVEGGNRPLVIVAHSKGGMEILHALLRYGERFPPEVVERALVVQSPLKGSPYADKLIREWDTSIFAWNPLYWWMRAQHAGFLSMTTPHALSDLATSLRLAPAEIRESLSERVFYLRSREEPAKVSVSLREYASSITSFGENDGLVPTKNMLLDGFGTDLGVESGTDHLENFVLGERPDAARLAKIRAFTQRIAKIATGVAASRFGARVGSCRGLF